VDKISRLQIAHEADHSRVCQPNITNNHAVKSPVVTQHPAAHPPINAENLDN